MKKRVKNGRGGRAIAFCLLICLIVGSVCFVSCSGSDIPEGMQDATCDGEYFRLYIPKSWQSSTDAGVSGGVYLVTETTSVSAMSTAVDEGVTNDSYAAATRSAYQTTLKGYTEGTSDVLSNKTLGGKASVRYRFSAEFGGVEHRCIQYFCLYRGRMTILSFMAPSDLYESRLEDAENIFDAFVFSDTAHTSENRENKIPEGVTAPDGMKLASDDRYSFRFFVPSDWVVEQGKDFPSCYVSADDKSNVSVMGYLPAAGTEADITAYWDGMKKDYEAEFADFKVLSEEKTTLSGKDAVAYICEGTLDGVSYRWKQVLAQTSMVYIITYTAKTDAFDLHTAELEQILNAFYFRSVSDWFDKTR